MAVRTHAARLHRWRPDAGDVTERPALFDVGPAERRTKRTKALVALDPGLCPTCGAGVSPITTHQAALLRHGGYGATERTTTLHCSDPGCRWTMQSERTEVNPRRDPVA